MKVYMVEMTHTQTGKQIQKFGKTSEVDVLKRFDTNRYISNTKYSDFNIRVLWSAYCTDAGADVFELEMQRRYPKNIYLESYLGVHPGYYDGLSGITEITVLGSDRNGVISELFKRKDGNKLKENDAVHA